jgi:DNA-binding GntR family transcriptional regulator
VRLQLPSRRPGFGGGAIPGTNATASIPAQIVQLIQTEAWPAGTHLPAQSLADRLRVSRSPVNKALQLLEEKGLLVRELNRGYFLAKPIREVPRDLVQSVASGDADASAAAYFKIAEDRLQGRLPDSIS